MHRTSFELSIVHVRCMFWITKKNDQAVKFGKCLRVIALVVNILWDVNVGFFIYLTVSRDD